MRNNECEWEVEGSVFPSGSLLLAGPMERHCQYSCRVDGGDWKTYVCASSDERQSMLEPVPLDFPAPPSCVEDIKTVTIDF